jgi:hypothetical protein
MHADPPGQTPLSRADQLAVVHGVYARQNVPATEVTGVVPMPAELPR